MIRNKVKAAKATGKQQATEAIGAGPDHPAAGDTKKRRGPGGGRKPKHVTLVTQGNAIALEAFPAAMDAAVKRALGGTYKAKCTKCGADIEVDVPGDKELLKLIIEKVGGKSATGGGALAEGGSGELTNGQLVKYARMITDWMDAVYNADTAQLEHEIARRPVMPPELEAEIAQQQHST